jgi:hypothetical protein
VALAAICLVLLGWAWRATQQVPEFYALQLQREASANLPLDGEALERKALELNSQIRHCERWQVRFTDDDINAWLAIDLPRKFSAALPDEVKDPRVAINSEMIQVACQVEGARLSSVVSIGVQPYVTTDANVIAVRLRQLRAGSLPLPLSQYLERITEQGAKAGIPIRWTEEEGEPVALISLPLSAEDLGGRQVRVEQIELGEGEMIVSGTSLPISPVPSPGGDPDRGQ